MDDRCKENGEANHGGQLFNTRPMGETRKKANCSTLLKRITNYKTVNSESVVEVVSSAAAFPRGAHVILSTQHEEHTCSNWLSELGRGVYCRAKNTEHSTWEDRSAVELRKLAAEFWKFSSDWSDIRFFQTGNIDRCFEQETSIDVENRCHRTIKQTGKVKRLFPLK